MRCVFVSVGGFLARVESETRCAIWTEEPTLHGFDPAKLITIDLSRTPNAAMAGELSWDAIEVDDYLTGPNGEIAGTTLGPRWPEMQMAGVVRIERAFLARLPDAVRPVIPDPRAHGHAYEYTHVFYWPHVDDARAGCRYAAHHAEILEERGTLARVRVFPPGRSHRPEAGVPMWIDLTAPDQCDAGRDQLTEIGVGAAPKTGALFLISGRHTAEPEPDDE